MAEQHEHIDYELITRYLAGETLPEESLRVERWLEASVENQKAFGKIEMLWDQSGKTVHVEEADVDVDQGWARLKGTIQQNNPAPSPAVQEPKTRSLFYYVSRVAAVLVIGVGMYLVYDSITGSPEKTILSATHQPVTDSLPDGSVISLNTMSKLIFSEDFDNKNREVSLVGEAHFDVVSNPDKPFVVNIEGVEVTVLGTSFFVNAYDSLSEIIIGVEEGRVAVKPENADEAVVLQKGESLSIDRSTKKVNPKPFEPNDLYWKSKTLIFHNQALEEVFFTLERIYDIHVSVENPDILHCRLTAKFYGEDIEQIFDIINTNFNLSTTHEKNLFVVSGKGCD